MKVGQRKRKKSCSGNLIPSDFFFKLVPLDYLNCCVDCK